MIAKKIKEKKTLPDNDLIGLLKKMVKQRNDSCEAYKKAGRNELLENEMSEIKIINEFLPKQLSEEETKKICLETMKKVGASSIKDRSSLRLRTISWNGEPNMVTLKLDNKYWPPFEIKKSNKEWKRNPVN